MMAGGGAWCGAKRQVGLNCRIVVPGQFIACFIRYGGKCRCRVAVAVGQGVLLDQGAVLPCLSLA